MVVSFEWPGTQFPLEFGPGVRYDKYTDNASETQPLGYASGAYAWQLTDNAKFTQGVSVLARKTQR
ncbi:putative outer membrane protein, acid-inducible [Escherichia coli]|nr:putative outer membrane protein, acid-inducible [Escherichia coli]